jgi:tyrosine-protein phosphatase SIW14
MQEDKKNLPNFAVVEPGIWRGAAPTPAGLKRLKELGIRTVIDLRIEKKGQVEEEAAVKSLGLNRVRIPLGAEAPTEKQVAQFLALLKKAKSEPVFVHCQHGADRTGAMVGIWRVTQSKWGFAQTYAEMRKYGFKTFLKDLKGSVEKRATKN